MGQEYRIYALCRDGGDRVTGSHRLYVDLFGVDAVVLEPLLEDGVLDRARREGGNLQPDERGGSVVVNLRTDHQVRPVLLDRSHDLGGEPLGDGAYGRGCADVGDVQVFAEHGLHLRRA